jgi:hypothetical protein
MKKKAGVRVVFATAVFAALMLGAAGCAEPPVKVEAGASQAAAAPAQKADVATKKTLRAFSSEQEMLAYFKQLAERARRAQRRAYAGFGATAEMSAPAPAMSIATKTEAAADQITNVQHAGVDEGDIVKLHGDQLVILRRGRLFTVDIGHGALEPISVLDAFGPDINPGGTWYDEMLVSDDTVVVIGYSYERGGTEVGLFQIDKSGKLTYRSTYHLRSNDYYSSRNYASRLIGHKLIFYSPLYWYPGGGDPLGSFPAVRKWHKGATGAEFQRIAAASNVYRPVEQVNPDEGLALHTVTICDLAGGGFDCKATSVMGPPGRVFYVSPTAVYVWVTNWWYQAGNAKQQPTLYRMPLDGSAPSALKVSGAPVDQFSFLESEDGYLNVLVDSAGSGDGMWRAERMRGKIALLRVPIASFGDGNDAAPDSSYRALPKPPGYTFQNRFAGDYLLYGSGSGWGAPNKMDHATLYAVRWAKGDLHELALTHGVDRIEQMGGDAVVVGTDGGDLHFTAVRLASFPSVAGDYIRQGASQGELRSHGFFYKPDSGETGMLGLPISRPGRPGYMHLFQDSAAILFLKNDALRFQEVGELEAHPEKASDDACRASCVDWYGNARPIFVRGRLFALLGYEMVEGSVEKGLMLEKRRISYAPENLAARK